METSMIGLEVRHPLGRHRIHAYFEGHQKLTQFLTESPTVVTLFLNSHNSHFLNFLSQKVADAFKTLTVVRTSLLSRKPVTASWKISRLFQYDSFFTNPC